MDPTAESDVPMNVPLLVSDIVRQTTVLIAQLSTAAGLRAPLSNIADQVFLELSKELEAQGVRRKVVADMFGLALRSYQIKVQRLSEAPSTTLSLWQKIYESLAHGAASRAELEQQNRAHAPKQVAAALQDMVQSGIAYTSGGGAGALYGLTSDADRRRLNTSAQSRHLVEMVWYLVASGSATTREELTAQLKLDPQKVIDALEQLKHDGHLSESPQLRAEPYEVAVGASSGWETAVLDHFRAVATAIASKVNRPYSQADDRIGGGTHTFRVHPGHPHAAEVYALLAETRVKAKELWRRVAATNEQTPPPEDADRVTFYYGQNLVIEARNDRAGTSTDE